MRDLYERALALRPEAPAWSVCIYRGASPLALRPVPGHTTPVLDRWRVHDVRARFVADPFLLRRQSTWHMFFEVMLAGENRGEIGHAESVDGWRWNYQRIVLREPYHLSYPGVFEWKGEHYMVPETLSAGAVRLYRADPFPWRWRHEATLLTGVHADPSLVRFDGRWWLFSCPRPGQNDYLELHWADDLRGPWQPHPQSPVVRDNAMAARPAGRPVSWAGSLWRYAQVCTPRYGAGVRAFRIHTLTPAEYGESEHPESPLSPSLPGGWNAGGNHQVDAHLLEDGSWLAAVDGQRLIN